MALVLAHLIGHEMVAIVQGVSISDRFDRYNSALTGRFEWEEREFGRIQRDQGLGTTEREALIQARLGQGKFRERVMQIERGGCRITRVTEPTHLVASHIKPWRESSNEERLEGANGLALTPSIDHLFDRGFISFEDHGELLVSPIADNESLCKMGIKTDRVIRVGRFDPVQQKFLEHHRENVFLKRHAGGAR